MIADDQPAELKLRSTSSAPRWRQGHDTLMNLGHRARRVDLSP
jgi:hypothetical protein